MPWKNKHQRKKQKQQQPVKTVKQNGTPQQYAKVSNGVTAVQQLQTARENHYPNGNIEQRGYYSNNPHIAHGNGSRVQGTDTREILERKTSQDVTQRPRSNAMTRQDYARTHQHVHADVRTHQHSYHGQQQRRSASPGRDTDAYLRQLEYQQNHQRAASPSGGMRDSQLRYQEYQQRQQFRSESPQRAASPQREISRNYMRHSDYQSQQRPLSPARIREDQLRQIEYQRQLRKQQERRTSSPITTSNRYASVGPTMTAREQVASDRRSRNEMDPRRTFSSREQKTMDGIMEGGTLTREQRRFLVQQQRAYKAAQENSQPPPQQNGNYTRNDQRIQGNVTRLSPEDVRQHHENVYLSRAQRSKSQQRLHHDQASPEDRSKTASGLDGKQRRFDNRDLHARSASLDRNLGYQAIMNDPTLNSVHSKSNGNLERLSQQQRNNNQSPRSPDGGMPPEMMKMMQQRIPSRRSTGALEAEKHRIRDELRQNANQQAGIQLRQTRSPPGDERHAGWRNAVIELNSSQNHLDSNHEIAVNMAHQGMTVVTIPYQHTVVRVDVHHESSSPEDSPRVTHLVPRSSSQPRKSPIPSPRLSKRFPRSPPSGDSNNSSPYRSKSISPDSSDSAPVPLPRRSRKHRSPKSPPTNRKAMHVHVQRDTTDGRSTPNGYHHQKDQSLKKFVGLPWLPPQLVQSESQSPTKSTKLAWTEKTGDHVRSHVRNESSPEKTLHSPVYNSPLHSPRTDSDSEDTPVPKPRRRKRSPRNDISEKETLTKSQVEHVKAVDGRKSPTKEAQRSPSKESPKTSPQKLRSSKSLFQNRRHSMGLDNKPRHPEPTTIPEQNAQKSAAAEIIPVSYVRRSSLEEIKPTLQNDTKATAMSLEGQKKKSEENVAINSDNLAISVDDNDDVFEKPKLKSNEAQAQNPALAKDIKNASAFPSTNEPASSKKTGAGYSDSIKHKDDCVFVEKQEPDKANEDVVLDVEKDRVETHEKLDMDIAKDGHNDSIVSNDVKEIEPRFSKDELNRSTSSSVQVMSNNSFTSKSSNEHEMTDSLSDSTGSHNLSPLAEDGDHVPVPPPRIRKNTKKLTKSSRRKPSEDSSESYSQDFTRDDYDALSLSLEEMKEDEDKVPGLGEYPYVKKRSVKGDRIWMYSKEQMGSTTIMNTGLRGLTSPTFQRKAKDRRRPQKMLPMPGGNSTRMPRQPRPQRMQTIVEALKSGLKDSIKLNREKLQAMQQHQNDVKAARTRQGFHYNLEKQVKVAERYLRKLQFHLAKVEELQEQYEKELKVREGAVNMVKAYSDSQTPHKKEPVSEAKLGVKDCTQALCAMEAELEANLGAFVIKIEGIAGFARVCRGDIFEVGFKLGFQKFKSKCKVEKDLSQSWEGDEILLYPMVADFLTIKVTEIRGIARSNVVIGNLEFDTSDFYQAEPQNLTIDVNENGTIKLNVIATWSPFHIDEDELKSPSKPINSYHKRERSFTEPAISTGQSFHSESSRSQSLRERSAPKPIDLGTNLVLTLEEAMHNTTRLLEILNGQYGELKTLEHNVDQLNTMLKDIAEKKKRESTISLAVKSALDSFDFLNEVEEQNSSDYEDSGSGSMEETNRRNTLDSTRSDSVISAGTDSTCSIDDFHPPSSPTTPKNEQSPRPDSQALPERPIQRKRGSKFIEMSEKRESRLLEMNEQRGSKLFETLDKKSVKSSTENGCDDGSALSCGNESVDMVLVQHLMYTEYLLSHLGAFGPLKLKETNALEKLHKQAVIIEQLITLCITKMEITSPDEILPDLKLNLPLLEFWEQSTGKEVLLVKADDFLLQLDVKFGAKLRTEYPDIADNVFESLCHRLVDRPVDLLSEKTVITLFQYITFFAEEERRHPEKFINDLTKEFELTASLEPGNPALPKTVKKIPKANTVELTASLEPGNPDLPKTVKRIPKATMLPAGNLRALALLLLEDSATVQTGVRMYYESITAEPSIRQKVITVYLECLEERDQALRQAGCAALAAMQATESLDQLVYLLRCDVDDVKTTAKVALMAFGEKGRLAYEQISFASYGDYPPYPLESTGGAPLQTTEL